MRDVCLWPFLTPPGFLSLCPEIWRELSYTASTLPYSNQAVGGNHWVTISP